MHTIDNSFHPSVYNYFRIFGLHVSTPPFGASASIIHDLTKQKHASYVCVVNTHVAIETIRCENYRRIIQQSDLTLPDGMPIVWYAKNILGLSAVEKVSGPDLMKKCFTDLSGLKHFFFGSTRDTLSKIKSCAKIDGLNLNIVGSYSPPFRPLTHCERQHVIAMINELAPDIIWVALGAPKQEYWMHEFKNHLDRGVMVGVGAAFDYFVGNIHRPPAWLIRAGLEWLCRLIQEPGRLWRRYFISNSFFLFLVLKEIILSHIFKKRKKSND